MPSRGALCYRSQKCSSFHAAALFFAPMSDAELPSEPKAGQRFSTKFCAHSRAHYYLTRDEPDIYAGIHARITTQCYPPPSSRAIDAWSGRVKTLTPTRFLRAADTSLSVYSLCFKSATADANYRAAPLTVGVEYFAPFIIGDYFSSSPSWRTKFWRFWYARWTLSLPDWDCRWLCAARLSFPGAQYHAWERSFHFMFSTGFHFYICKMPQNRRHVKVIFMTIPVQVASVLRRYCHDECHELRYYWLQWFYSYCIRRL